MQTNNETIQSIEDLQHLPAYAHFLLHDKLNELATLQTQIAREIDLPLLRHLKAQTDEELVIHFERINSNILGYLARNEAALQIDHQLKEWLNNLSDIERNQLTSDDIVLTAYLRKKSYLHFLPEYCSDVHEMLELIKEIDLYLLQAQKQATKRFIEALKDQVAEHAHLIERITNTTPGIIYVYNIEQDREIYANQSTASFLGYTPEELTGMGNTMVSQLMHPEDQERLKEYDETFLDVKDGEVRSFKYRMRNRKGEYRWLRTYETVFKRNKLGMPVEKIGIAIDVHEQKLVADELQRKDFLYKQAQAISKTGNWTMNLKDQSITWSDEMYNIFELPIGSKITLEQWASFVHPDDKESVNRHLADFLKNKTIYDAAHRIVLPNGKEKTLHRRVELQLDANGEPEVMVGITQDVTELRRIEQELREHQIFIRKITDAAPTIIASYNAHNGKFAFLNQGIEKLLGYPVEECFAQGVGFLHSIIHPDDKEDTLEKRAQALEKAHSDKDPYAVAEFTYRMRHRNGHYRWFHTYATVFDRNAEGQVENLLTITIDVSEQKEASEKIKEQEYFIQQIADASPTILYLFDVATQSMVYMNREVFFVLGYVPEEMLEAEDGVTDMLYHPDDIHLLPGRKQSQKNFQQVDSMIQYECRMKSREDEWRWFLVREIVFKTGEKGEVKQILGAALDINRRKEMERTILQNTLQLEQSNSSLEEFAYVASHDLKEPLRKISTFGDRLASSQSDQLSAEGKMYLTKIIDASQRMQTMINDLLSISMISGNRSFEHYSLQKILDETLLTLEFKIEQKNAVIKSTPLPEANVIVSQFRQLFQNLLSNSLKFTKPDVQPLIQIEHSFVDPKDAIHYQLNNASQYLKIVFTDNGIGFENEFAGKIFTIFHRLHGRSEYEGSGIGLAICKKIVAHHGGIIYAEGQPDVGALFTIILPA